MTHRRAHPTLVLALLALLCLGVAVAAASAGTTRQPAIRIVKAPPARTSSTEAIFRVAARGARTWCRRDGKRFRPCNARVRYTGLRVGRHTFVVRAVKHGRERVLRRSWVVLPRGGRDSAQSDPSAAPAYLARAGALVFADEFDGDGVDDTAWSRYDSPGNGGIGLRRPSAFSTDGHGNLVVTAAMKDGQIVSGGMSHRTARTYGRYVFRVRTEPDPTGTMSGVVLTWPLRQRSPEFTENDMYETGKVANNTRQFYSFVHFGIDNSQRWFRHDSDPTQWHEIAMDWSAERIDLYRDGALVWSVTDREAIPDVAHRVCIQLDPRTNAALDGPVRMFVDYVRIYE